MSQYILNKSDGIWSLRTLTSPVDRQIYQLEISLDDEGSEQFKLFEIKLKGGFVDTKIEVRDMLAITNFKTQRAIDPGELYIREVMTNKWMDIRNSMDVIYSWE